MLPEAYVVHRMDGRLRLRIPERARDATWFVRVAERLLLLPGVESVTSSAVAGSVLLLHHAALPDIARFARDEGLFRMVTADPPVIPLSHRITAGCSVFGSQVRSLSGGTVDMEGLVMLGLAAAGSWQLLKGKNLPPAVTLFWYAAALMSRSRSRRE